MKEEYIWNKQTFYIVYMYLFIKKLIYNNKKERITCRKCGNSEENKKSRAHTEFAAGWIS